MTPAALLDLKGVEAVFVSRDARTLYVVARDGVDWDDLLEIERQLQATDPELMLTVRQSQGREVSGLFVGLHRVTRAGCDPSLSRVEAEPNPLDLISGRGMTDAEVIDLISRATVAFKSLTPEQQAAHRREQAIDFAYGQLMASTNHREGVTRERIAELYDQTRPRP